VNMVLLSDGGKGCCTGNTLYQHCRAQKRKKKILIIKRVGRCTHLF